MKWEALAEHETAWKTKGLGYLCHSIIMKEVIEDTYDKAEDTVR